MMRTDQIRVFIADDHPIVRHGLRALIERQPDMTVVGEASDGHAVVNAPDRATWDILLLDLSLPLLSGIEVTRRLCAEAAAPRIVVLSMYPRDQFAPQMLAAGAATYLSKSLPPHELIDTLRAVAAGRIVRGEGEAFPLAADDAAPHQGLSAREHQVFMRIFQGRTVTEIAAELNVSVSTVSTHLTNVKQKLGAHSIGDIVTYAHRIGLVV